MNEALIRKRLLELGWSDMEFATKLDVSMSTVYNMLAGKRVRVKIAYKAHQLLDVPLKRLAPYAAEKLAS